ncbi:MAG: hypothetical protein ACR2PQ_00350, partial [Myxococcota bacterium]
MRSRARKPTSPGSAPARGRRRGRRVRWVWALPGVLLVLLQLVLVYDGFSFARALGGYSERALPSWKLEWQIRRHVRPALARSDPDEALRRLAEVDSESRLFEHRVTPLRIEAYLAKDDLPRALAEYQRHLEYPDAAELPPWITDVLNPQLEAPHGPPTRIRFADATHERAAAFE